MRLIAPVALAWVLVACQAQPPVQAPPPAATEGTLLARMQAEIGDAPCSADAQCRTLAVGERACGGPERWLAWSTANAQDSRLSAWAAEHAALQRANHQQSGRMSTCQVITDPGAACVAQRCVLRPRGLPN